MLLNVYDTPGPSHLLQVKYSAAALLEYLRPLSGDSQATQVFSEVVLQIFRDHQKTDRITLPMFKMLDQLLANGCFEIFADEEFVPTLHHDLLYSTEVLLDLIQKPSPSF